MNLPCWIAAFALAIVAGPPAHAFDLYVAPNGNDAWSGTAPVHRAGSKVGPLASLEKARDAARVSKARAVTVWLRGGAYVRSRSFVIGADDSRVPVTYRAYRGEKPRLVGGRTVSGFRPVDDPAVLARLDEKARGHVVVADLRAQGITDYGELRRRGFGMPIVPAQMELFFQGEPMELARWPNAPEFAKTAGAPRGPEGGCFSYTGDRPARWVHDDDVWVHGYWTWDWADSYEKVKAIDPAKHEIETVPPGGVYGYAAGKRWYALNILEELDTPGEYYIDRKAGKLYFWPPAPIRPGDAIVSMLEQPVIELRDASNVRVEGLTIECSRGSGIVVSGGRRDAIAGCTLRNLGTFAASVASPESGVVSCDVHDCGDGGISISAGDRMTLTPGHAYALNNRIYRYNRWSFCYRPAVGFGGVGNRIAHNVIHDSPHLAITGGGNDNVIEYNEIYRVCTSTSDAGAFYMGRNMTMRGNVVRFNYFHDLRTTGDVQSIYLDDCFCGTTIFGNVIVNGGRGVLIGGGRDNRVENNIFIDCHPAVHVDARGKGWASFWFNGKDPTLMNGLKAVHFDQPPYSTHYPQLATLMSDDPAEPKGNVIERNIAVGGRWLELYDKLTDKVVTVRDNLTSGDPGFVDAAKRDYRLLPDSPALALGFRPIPFEKIGLYRDRWRPHPERSFALGPMPSGR